ncbi:hypothetical protein B9Z19DRAFT_728285 [Tuber borchii]|uniref:Uncharacterized protein n=1 Tax=Tuber borchii TaxID=42251 RepID=A0A2T6Z9R3_TUBBO|nr:hypothetical protein B9Z19DRAFT_728285 [Tuber borchii]
MFSLRFPFPLASFSVVSIFLRFLFIRSFCESQSLLQMSGAQRIRRKEGKGELKMEDERWEWTNFTSSLDTKWGFFSNRALPSLKPFKRD